MSGRRGAAAVLLLGFVIAACSPAASVAPSLTPSPEPTASPSPTPSPSPSATPLASTAADPADGLKIAAPYSLTPLDPALEASFRQQFTATAGAFASLIGIGGRDVVKSGALAGFALVIAFPPGIMSDATYQSMLAGLASSSKITLVKMTVSGVDVSSGSNGTGNLGVFRAGDHIIVVVTPTSAELSGVTRALITANQ